MTYTEKYSNVGNAAAVHGFQSLQIPRQRLEIKAPRTDSEDFLKVRQKGGIA